LLKIGNTDVMCRQHYIALMQVIHLAAWYRQPVHCPFCGDGARGQDTVAGCWHYIYVIQNGELVDYRDRLREIFGLAPGYKPFSTDADIPAVVDAATTNAMEYRITDPGGKNTHICFAARDVELCGWGIDNESPYQD